MTYEYYCKECQETFEHICKMADKPKQLKCPECKSLCKPAMSIVGATYPHGKCKGGYKRAPY